MEPAPAPGRGDWGPPFRAGLSRGRPAGPGAGAAAGTGEAPLAAFRRPLGEAPAAGEPPGRPADLAALLARLAPRLERILLRFGIPHQDAQDLVQDTLLLYHQKAPFIRSPESWVVSTLANRCKMHWRHWLQHHVVLVAPHTLSDLAETLGAHQPPEQVARDLAADLAAAMAELSPRHRRLLHARYILGQSAQEAAQSAGYPVGSLRKTLARIRAKLRPSLAAYRPDE
jgi:RNA polymerase sigma-70 factor (ECF subfamily)